ncbi:MAG TPA: inositol monophosphatase family protein [Burkholderiales bacterium]|nr:inositol monophosphatase family protein [Burkholderiales bacterium]
METLIKSVIRAVREVAQAEIMPRYLQVAQQRKADGSLYTEADIAAQEALAAKLRQIHPSPVLAEEMSREQQAEQWLAGDSGLWCVDPIDGTSNFVNGLPYFAVSVALMNKGRSVLGVIYDPVSHEMYYAEKGAGAYLNGERLPINESEKELHQCMASVDFKRISTNLARQLVGTPPYSSLRNYGASTLEWCYVAAGRFDVYLHGGQRLWDYAAGSLILEEAGGMMCSLKSDDFWADDLWKRSVIAARNPTLFHAWKTWLRARQ